ncbi:MAG: hypothetical protein AAFV88_00480 [Planctomycetota bacterium]
MQIETLHDLLPLDPAEKKPNAYQVFGLQGSEPDNEIQATIRDTCDSLKKRREISPPNTWQQAARMVTAARAVLEDSQQKAKLDRKLAQASSPSNDILQSDASADPLAGLLPGGNPLAASPLSGSSSPASQPTSASAADVLGLTRETGNSQPSTSNLGMPPVAATPPVAVASPATEPDVTTDRPSAAGLDWSPPAKSIKRRKKNKASVFVFGAIVILMLGSIAFLLHRITKGDRIALTPDGEIAETSTNDSNASRSAKPMPRPRGDGIMPASAMGDATPQTSADRKRKNSLSPPGGFEFQPKDGPPAMGSSMDSGASDDDSSEMPGDLEKMPGDTANTMTQPAMPATGMEDPFGDVAEKTTDDSGQPMSDPAAMEMAATQMETAEQFENVERLIKSGDWAQMKPAASALLKLDLQPDQFKRASALYDIADLASYYQGAIVRGLASLTVGNDFEVVEGLRVIVVEVDSESITIQFNKRSHTYPADALPPRFMERIASFQLDPEDPAARAGLALYRLIHSSTQPEYREDAWSQLQALDGQLKEVDTKLLISTSKELLAE